MYATDASNYRQVPIGIVIPRTIQDVGHTIAICREHNAPILSRGGGTSLAGQCCNAAIVMDFSKYLNQVLEVDPEARRARVQPGTVLDELRNEAEKHHLTFGPDPATHDRCTLGGMIGNNSCGIHSVMAGRTVDNVEELEILTYDGLRMRVGRTSDEELARIIAEGGRRGDIYAHLGNLRDRYADLIRRRFPKFARRVSGYNLDELLPENGFNVARALVGTEGTCVTILEAKLQLVHSPPVRTLLVLGYPDVFASAEAVCEILTFKPVGLEGMDDYLRNFLRAKRGLTQEQLNILPEGTGWLLVEFGGESLEDAETQSRRLMDALARKQNPPSMKLTNVAEAKFVWDVRKSGLGATSFLPDGRSTWPGWEDAAVPPDKLADYLRDFKGLRDSFGYESAMYGHFGEGCVHMRIDFDLFSREGVAKFMKFLDAAGDLVVKYGGSMSGEHGDGQARAHLLPKTFGPELMEAFREFKSIWDPQNKMNPGKVVDAFRADENLRFGAEYKPWQPETHFHFPESSGNFSRAMLRCVGVGKCRRMEEGTMCPSYMVTHEEKHSTRGRARLLQEMLRGEVIGGGWKSEEVKDALDLCLACKGCKSDCPVNVDMATYKAEFLSHYYKGRMRPRTAYSMGMFHRLAPIASKAPWAFNAIGHTPVLNSIVKALGGISPHRELPRFAKRSFKSEWFEKPRTTASAPAGRGQRVILWPDTFNNYLSPQIAHSAARVLSSAGFDVSVPRANLCCGRPLYDFGFLDLAKKQLRGILDALRNDIEAGIPLVGLEPSCITVFRDELANLFPEDPLARKLAGQSYVFAEFLEKFAPDWIVTPPQPDSARVFLHGHCHQKAVIGMRDDVKLLTRFGFEVEMPDTGCCGMAGSFGFNKHHYEVSMAVGERVLLPAVRAAIPQMQIVSDGFSCREQIRQATDRKALHLAQVLDHLVSTPA